MSDSKNFPLLAETINRERWHKAHPSAHKCMSCCDCVLQICECDDPAAAPALQHSSGLAIFSYCKVLGRYMTSSVRFCDAFEQDISAHTFLKDIGNLPKP